MDEKCVFCDRKNLEEQLVGENKDFYVVATLGQITDGGYVLLIPKRHVPCLAQLNPSELYELRNLMSRISVSLRKAYGPESIYFEHGIVGQTIQQGGLNY